MTKKKIELSKETLRELTMRTLTEEEMKRAAGGTAPGTGSAFCFGKGSVDANSCKICYEN